MNRNPRSFSTISKIHVLLGTTVADRRCISYVILLFNGLSYVCQLSRHVYRPDFKAGFLFSARAGSGIVIARLEDGCEYLSFRLFRRLSRQHSCFSTSGKSTDAVDMASCVMRSDLSICARSPAIERCSYMKRVVLLEPSQCFGLSHSGGSPQSGRGMFLFVIAVSWRLSSVP